MADQPVPPGGPAAPGGAVPPPQTEAAASLSGHWEAVLCFADLCAADPAQGVRLAAEAFARAVPEAGGPAPAAAEPPAAAGPGGAPLRPWLPLLLTAVRDTAAEWEAGGQGDRLHPELRDRLAAERTAPGPLPLARRAFEDLPEADRALLWAVEVESSSRRATAELLGTSPASAVRETARVREAFRERCLRAHAHGDLEGECRAYARLLDAATRSAGAVPPDDLRRHLSRCAQCRDAADCLAQHGGRVPAALAAGVLGWGGRAYLFRRHLAAAQKPDGDRLAAAARTALPARALAGLSAGLGAGRVRTAAVAAAFAAVVLAAAVTMAEAPSSSQDARDVPASTRTGSPTAQPPGTGSPGPAESRSPDDMDGAAAERSLGPASNASTPPAPSSSPSGAELGREPAAAYCTASYTPVNTWPGGFQAAVSFSTAEALDGWWASWSFPDGQRLTQMWNGSFSQRGARITVTPADYNRRISGGQSFTVGFLGTRDGGDSAPTRFILNGHTCETGPVSPRDDGNDGGDGEGRYGRDDGDERGRDDGRYYGDRDYGDDRYYGDDRDGDRRRQGRDGGTGYATGYGSGADWDGARW